MTNYTPDEDYLIAQYVASAEHAVGEPCDEFEAEARRGIAKIKADALREAADDIALALTEDVSKVQQDRMKYAIGYLRARANDE